MLAVGVSLGVSVGDSVWWNDDYKKKHGNTDSKAQNKKREYKGGVAEALDALTKGGEKKTDAPAEIAPSTTEVPPVTSP